MAFATTAVALVPHSIFPSSNHSSDSTVFYGNGPQVLMQSVNNVFNQEQNNEGDEQACHARLERGENVRGVKWRRRADEDDVLEMVCFSMFQISRFYVKLSENTLHFVSRWSSLENRWFARDGTFSDVDGAILDCEWIEGKKQLAVAFSRGAVLMLEFCRETASAPRNLMRYPPTSIAVQHIVRFAKRKDNVLEHASGSSMGSLTISLSCPEEPSATNVERLHGHQGAVFALAWNELGTELCSGGEDRVVRLWRRRSESERVFDLVWSSFGPKARVWSVSFVGHSRVVTTGEDPTSYIWDASNGARLLELNGHESKNVWCCAGSGVYAATGGSSGVKVWNVETQESLVRTNTSTPPTKRVPKAEHVIAVAMRSLVDMVVVYSTWRTSLVSHGNPVPIDLLMGLEEIRAGGYGAPRVAHQSGSYLVIGSTNGSVFSLNLENRNEVSREKKLHAVGITLVRCLFMQDGRFLVLSGSADGWLKLDGISIRLSDRRSSAILCAARLSCDRANAMRFAVGDRSGTIRMAEFDLERKTVAVLAEYTGSHGATQMSEIVVVENESADFASVGFNGCMLEYKFLVDKIVVTRFRSKLGSSTQIYAARTSNASDAVVLAGTNGDDFHLWHANVKSRSLLSTSKLACINPARPFDMMVRDETIVVGFVDDSGEARHLTLGTNFTDVGPASHARTVWTCAWMNGLLVTGSEDETLRLWKAGSSTCEALTCLDVLDTQTVRGLCVMENRSMVVSCGGARSITCWRLTSSNKLVLMARETIIADNYEEQQSEPIRFLCLCDLTPNDSDEPLLLVGGSDGRLRFFQLCSRSVSRDFEDIEEEDGDVSVESEVRQIPKHRKIMNQVSRHDRNSSKLTTEMKWVRLPEEFGPGTHPFLCVSSLSDNLVVTGESDGMIRVWRCDPKTLSLNQIGYSQAHLSGANCMDVYKLSNGTVLIATGGDDQGLSLAAWRGENRPVGGVRRPDVAAAAIGGVSILSAEGNEDGFLKLLILVASADQRVSVWSVELDLNAAIEVVVKPTAFKLIRQRWANVGECSAMRRYGERIAMVGSGVETMDLSWIGGEKL